MDVDIEHQKGVPQFLDTEAFIAARLKEISALSNLMEKNNKVTSIFQRLPKHMRRRAMSHTVKRVPRNLREAHKRQLQKNKALKKTKNRRSQFRKRAKKLPFEYNRRQKVFRWLETHIWHAKRFRMVAKWNYKIAQQSFNKMFRACYRAMRSHCLIQDISYYVCIELCATVEQIATHFKLITHSDCGLSINAKCWVSGNREGTITLYHANSYPCNVIGNVTFMWRPSTESVRTLWLWCHPAFYEEVLNELVKVFNLQLLVCDSQETEKVDSNENEGTELERIKMNLKNVPHTKVPRYVNEQENVILLLLKDTLNRFRLTGPFSNAALTKALHSAELFDEVLLTPDTHYWWTKYRSQHKNLAKNLDLLKLYSIPSQLPSHVILGAHVIDPRLLLRQRRTKAVPVTNEIEPCLFISTDSAESSIWNATVRDTVSIRKFPTAKLNKLRSELLVAGFDEQLLAKVKTVVPILLVQRPGFSSLNIKSDFGSGWDLILPANWAVPIWLSLILCGARPGALRETCTLNLEMQKMPELLPDSCAGAAYYEEIANESENKYFRMPPNKRNNYIKFGFPSPFRYSWDQLIRDWSPIELPSSFFVLRNKRELRELRECTKTHGRSRKVPHISSQPGALVPVNITVLGNGCLTPFSHICIPTEFDLRARLADKKFDGPVETLHNDTNQQKRKILKTTHIQELKRLQRKRRKIKKQRLKNEIPVKITKKKCSPTEEIVKAYQKASRGLWLPSDVTSLRTYCAREICGFVINSGFSFLQACTTGQGYVTYKSFLQLLNVQRQLKGGIMVLTRAPNSLNYRFCSLDIIL